MSAGSRRVSCAASSSRRPLVENTIEVTFGCNAPPRTIPPDRLLRRIDRPTVPSRPHSGHVQALQAGANNMYVASRLAASSSLMCDRDGASSPPSAFSRFRDLAGAAASIDRHARLWSERSRSHQTSRSVLHVAITGPPAPRHPGGERDEPRVRRSTDFPKRPPEPTSMNPHDLHDSALKTRVDRSTRRLSARPRAPTSPPRRDSIVTCQLRRPRPNHPVRPG